MNIQKVINCFNKGDSLSDSELIGFFQPENKEKVLKMFREKNNRELARYLLKYAITQRDQLKRKYPVENLMYASFLLAIHKNVTDSLLIWEAKSSDFDAYCGLDIQLVVGGGVEATINYLRNQNTQDAWNALEYIEDCKLTGDFIYLESYYKNIPWYIYDEDLI